MKLYQAGTLFCALAYLSSCARIIEGPLTSCSQQGLEQCHVGINNCHRGWLERNAYTPSAPEHLEVDVDTRRDESGDLVPVIVARWKAKDDGSIQSMKGTELHVMMTATNQNLCVRYSFPPPSSMRNPHGDKWSFTADMVAVDPEQTYMVSVNNLPKPELDHTSYDISAQVTVPGCEDPKIQKTKFCVESGSFWEPNITLARSAAVLGRSALDVGFWTHQLSEDYSVLVQCSPVGRDKQWKDVQKNNQTYQSVTFDLGKFPRTCCYIDVEIQPFFPQCTNDCVRQRRTFHICREVVPRPDAPDDLGNPTMYWFAAVGVAALCGTVGCLVCVLCRRQKRPPEEPLLPGGGQHPKQSLPRERPKVLVIYSQDHRLYRDIVLKLCGFLRAKCGAEVLVDLLDSTWLSAVGRLRWLEGQRQQLTGPSDKVLVLCSRGVQAKWRAMCGQGQVTLREDVLSPTDDMLVPFLSLVLSDVHQPGALGRYMVAYFDGVSGERDVPSVFDMGAKYRLMKHFEELYFRILDVEKYQLDQVNHIEGIGGDEYFNCPSGRALRDAVETFHAYQLENPDWFERECVESEEEASTAAESRLLVEQMQIPPVLECVPQIREGPPVYASGVEVNRSDGSVYVLTPELSTGCGMASIVELEPRLNLEHHPAYRQHEVLLAHPRPRNDSSEPIYVAAPAPLMEKRLRLEEEEAPTGSGRPAETAEEDFLVPPTHPSPDALRRLLALQRSLGPVGETPSVAVEVEYPPPLGVSGHSLSQPVELEEEEEEEEAIEPSGGKGPSSGSDQGYNSKMSSQRDSPVEDAYEDPLAALARLQEELFMNSATGMCPEMC